MCFYWDQHALRLCTNQSSSIIIHFTIRQHASHRLRGESSQPQPDLAKTAWVELSLCTPSSKKNSIRTHDFNGWSKSFGTVRRPPHRFVRYRALLHSAHSCRLDIKVPWRIYPSAIRSEWSLIKVLLRSDKGSCSLCVFYILARKWALIFRPKIAWNGTIICQKM
jgi:hypothetical protein